MTAAEIIGPAGVLAGVAVGKLLDMWGDTRRASRDLEIDTLRQTELRESQRRDLRRQAYADYAHAGDQLIQAILVADVDILTNYRPGRIRVPAPEFYVPYRTARADANSKFAAVMLVGPDSATIAAAGLRDALDRATRAGIISHSPNVDPTPLGDGAAASRQDALRAIETFLEAVRPHAV